MSKGLAGKFIVALTCAPKGWLRAGHGLLSIIEGLLSLPIKFLQGSFRWVKQDKTQPDLFSAAKDKVAKGCREIKNNWIQLLELSMFVGMLFMFAMPISLILGWGMIIAMCFVVRGVFQVSCPKEVLYEQQKPGTEQKKTPGCLELLNRIICAPIVLLRSIIELVSSLVYALKGLLLYLVASKASPEYSQSSKNCAKFSAYYAINSLNSFLSTATALLLFLPVKILSWFAPERAERIFGFCQNIDQTLYFSAAVFYYVAVLQTAESSCCGGGAKQKTDQYTQPSADGDKSCVMDTNISEASATGFCASRYKNGNNDYCIEPFTVEDTADKYHNTNNDHTCCLGR